jgi:hypothetical protein
MDMRIFANALLYVILLASPSNQGMASPIDPSIVKSKVVETNTGNWHGFRIVKKNSVDLGEIQIWQRTILGGPKTVIRTIPLSRVEKIFYDTDGRPAEFIGHIDSFKVRLIPRSTKHADPAGFVIVTDHGSYQFQVNALFDSHPTFIPVDLRKATSIDFKKGVQILNPVTSKVLTSQAMPKHESAVGFRLLINGTPLRDYSVISFTTDGQKQHGETWVYRPIEQTAVKASNTLLPNQDIHSVGPPISQRTHFDDDGNIVNPLWGDRKISPDEIKTASALREDPAFLAPLAQGPLVDKEAFAQTRVQEPLKGAKAAFNIAGVPHTTEIDPSLPDSAFDGASFVLDSNDPSHNKWIQSARDLAGFSDLGDGQFMVDKSSPIYEDLKKIILLRHASDPLPDFLAESYRFDPRKAADFPFLNGITDLEGWKVLPDGEVEITQGSPAGQEIIRLWKKGESLSVKPQADEAIQILLEQKFQLIKHLAMLRASQLQTGTPYIFDQVLQAKEQLRGLDKKISSHYQVTPAALHSKIDNATGSSEAPGRETGLVHAKSVTLHQNSATGTSRFSLKTPKDFTFLNGISDLEGWKILPTGMVEITENSPAGQEIDRLRLRGKALTYIPEDRATIQVLLDQKLRLIDKLAAFKESYSRTASNYTLDQALKLKEEIRKLDKQISGHFQEVPTELAPAKENPSRYTEKGHPTEEPLLSSNPNSIASLEVSGDEVNFSAVTGGLTQSQQHLLEVKEWMDRRSKGVPLEPLPGAPGNSNSTGELGRQITLTDLNEQIMRMERELLELKRQLADRSEARPLAPPPHENSSSAEGLAYAENLKQTPEEPSHIGTQISGRTSQLEERFRVAMDQMSRFASIFPEANKRDLEKAFEAYRIDLADFEELNAAIFNPKRLPLHQYEVEIAALAKSIFFVKDPFKNPNFSALALLGALESVDAFTPENWKSLAPKAAKVMSLAADRNSNALRVRTLERIRDQVISQKITTAQASQMLQRISWGVEKAVPDIFLHYLIPVSNRFPADPENDKFLLEGARHLSANTIGFFSMEFARLYRNKPGTLTMVGAEPWLHELSKRVNEPQVTQALAGFFTYEGVSPDLIKLAHKQIREVKDHNTLYSYVRYFLRQRPVSEVADLLPVIADKVNPITANEMFRSVIGRHPVEDWLSVTTHENPKEVERAIVMLASRADGGDTSNWIQGVLMKADPMKVENLTHELALKLTKSYDINALVGMISRWPEPQGHRLAQDIFDHHFSENEPAWVSSFLRAIKNKDPTIYADLVQRIHAGNAKRGSVSNENCLQEALEQKLNIP